jgi:hypothetical protein
MTPLIVSYKLPHHLKWYMFLSIFVLVAGNNGGIIRRFENQPMGMPSMFPSPT